MKCLLYITNYEANKKIKYVNRILAEFNSFEFLDVDVIIYSTDTLKLDIFDNLNITVEVRPLVFSNSEYAASWQPEPEFIWLYRKDMMDKIDMYDLYIHLEDDILISRDNIQQFIKYNVDTNIDKYITGHIIYEDDGVDCILPQFHYWFKDIEPVFKLNGEYFMQMANVHQASNLISNTQLELLMGEGLLNPTPHLAGIYNIKCSAESEIYTTPLLTKIIPVGNLKASLVKHLTNKYIPLSNTEGDFWYEAFQTLVEIQEQINKSIEKLENE